MLKSVRFMIIVSMVALVGTVQAQKANQFPSRPAPAWLQAGAIYQMQLRAFTPEGTLKAAEAKLPHIANLGVGCVYLCPFFVANKTDDKKMWSPRQKASKISNAVSSYCMNDYWNVDEEYGKNEDFKDFVATAHRLGMKVMIDLVYAHCSQFQVFLKDHPDFVVRNPDGSLKISPWASLTINFNSPALREYLYANIIYWMAQYQVDAFRCDVADAIPLDFWEEARARAERFNPQVAFLAEGDRTKNQIKAFDVCYGFTPMMRGIFPIMDGKKPASNYAKIWDSFMSGRTKGYRGLGMFDTHDVSNDDYQVRREKRWGHAACDAVFVLNYLISGVPFIYNGQEFCDEARHSIFGKMPMDWSAMETPAGKNRTALLKKLATIRKAENAVQSGAVEWVENDCPNEILSFWRKGKEGRPVFCFVNLRDKPVTVTFKAELPATALLSHGTTWKDKTVQCAPFAYEVR